jgi:glycosyltransferase involved in cell wall biosynthesis
MSGDFFVSGLRRLRIKPSSVLIKIFILIRNKILRKADLFVSVSSEITTELTTNGVNSAKIRYIPNPVDVKRFTPANSYQRAIVRSRLGLLQEDKIFIFTGRLVAYKGLPLLVSVWKEIQKRHMHVKLLLVGCGGNDMHNCEGALREYVESNSLHDSIYLTGAVSNVEEYLQASDVFVFPTENEAFGISLIEAMACGLPVISTPVGGVKDIITHRQNGLLVEAGDFHQLHDAIHLLITDASLSASLGGEALKTVNERYAVDNVNKEYIKLFEFLSKKARCAKWTIKDGIKYRSNW